MATVTRVLPWRRNQQPALEKLGPLIELYRTAHPRASIEAIHRAYEFAERAHEGQKRKSGEPYITHPLAVATIVAKYGLDENTVCAALLHDAVEDTNVTLADVEREFGAEVARLVDGVTKLDRIHFDSKQAQQAAAIRKMLVATATDIRVLVIKLSDRLHNMRTIAAIPAAKQAKTAHETLDVYAPLAHRLGMGELKQQLEDLCFASLHPKRYAEIDHMVATRAPERELYLMQVEEEVRQRLGQVQIEADVTSRSKHLASIYEKMVVRGKEFDDIFDLVGMRVIVNSEKDCYAALGSIHSLWTPVAGRFKDYIATPKFNLYQSLHTTVVGPQGKPLEVQIRTREMHQRAESGLAAHFVYKAGEGPSEDLPWLSRMVDWQRELIDPDEFMANLKTDLEQDEVYCFTPKGDVHNLPKGSTAIDFAYSVHTEVGHRCIGARVGGRLVPLDHKLQSGDTVEIFTSKVDGAGPSLEWLDFVATRAAQQRIRQWFNRERRVDAVETGRDELDRALRGESTAVRKLATDENLEQLAPQFGIASLEALLAAIAEGKVEATEVVAKLTIEKRGVAAGQTEMLSSSMNSTHGRYRHAVGVNVEGYDDELVRIAKCCTPVPGDRIIGFMTRGRGVSVHRADCDTGASLAREHNERLIDVSWDEASAGTFTVAVELKALDRTRLLQEVTQSLSDQQVNILSCNTSTGADRVSKMRFEFELGDPSHLDAILSTLRQIDSVYDAYRSGGGG
ncbi:MAG: bifunctional (p)ppGpp synthetase/guanosine-3',5'-bis(diphosphate) 3'-pyrophosphohydrolase [Actinobacteria bacterium]|nr:bifunctional (p)ppGpp synthetase/guanosine-3',5'-bis(diphosphate) 3'-pyrophosphohydrolase [Actinomycetota bacterium]